MELEDIRQRCRIDDETGCWIWSGAASRNSPRVWAPHLGKPGAPLETQIGRRAVWQLSTGKPIPKGYKVFSICQNQMCLNPGRDHMKCGPSTEWGRQRAIHGVHKTAERKAAARRTGRAKSNLTDETYSEILLSTEKGTELSARLNLSRQTISKVRRGRIVSFQPVGGLFSGLLR